MIPVGKQFRYHGKAKQLSQHNDNSYNIQPHTELQMYLMCMY